MLALAALAFGAEGRLTVAREATVSGDTIRLGDIAALDGERAKTLAGVVLGPAPGAGETRTLDGALLLQTVRRDAGSLDGIIYTIPATVRVRRATQEVSEAAVRGIVESHLAAALGGSAKDVELRGLELPHVIRIPTGAYRARVLHPAGAPLLGRVRLQVEFLVDERPVKTVWVSADIGLYASIVVVRRPVARGEALGSGDLGVERRDLSQTPRDVLTDVDEAARMTARSAIMPYTAIRRDQVDAPSAVRRGDAVLLVAERGALRITAPGEAREDASPGAQVRVMNRQTKKDLLGHVLDARTVRVDF
jgi:flagella basal body P-ring formation protein FlgA